MQGATNISIFTGIMTTDFYVTVLVKGMLPFLHGKY